MKTEDLEAGKRNLAEYLTKFYGVQRHKAAGQPATPVAIDPLKVAAEAKQYQNAERAKGNEISTTEAVALVLSKEGKG